MSYYMRYFRGLVFRSHCLISLANTCLWCRCCWKICLTQRDSNMTEKSQLGSWHSSCFEVEGVNKEEISTLALVKPHMPNVGFSFLRSQKCLWEDSVDHYWVCPEIWETELKFFMTENEACASLMHLLGKFPWINMYVSAGGLLPTPPPPIYHTFSASAPTPDSQVSKTKDCSAQSWYNFKLHQAMENHRRKLLQARYLLM